MANKTETTGTLGPLVRRWATKEEIAVAKGIGVRTLETLMAKGLPHFKLSRRVGFDPESVDQWLKQNHGVNQ
jgi:hypothetical protein